MTFGVAWLLEEYAVHYTNLRVLSFFPKARSRFSNFRFYSGGEAGIGRCNLNDHCSWWMELAEISFSVDCLFPSRLAGAVNLVLATPGSTKITSSGIEANLNLPR